ncbi:MAG: ribonuclease E/G [Bacteroidetes bacterium]|nr:MAG: ribonuclease E/G [Bacteroidota bacterium]PIE88211.1 MAG: ribonuclease E/G [Bacteroidota bacterium]
MTKELYVDANRAEVNIALLEDKSLVELHKEKSNNNFSVGDIYLGRVKKIVPSLNAAFVSVGHSKDAFLHYLDLGPQVRSLIKYTQQAQQGGAENLSMPSFKLEKDIEKTGKISGVLSHGQPILVQVTKEPISTKGPRVTSEVSFAGRYLVLVPFSNRISVSQKIKSVEERNRLKRLISSIKPKNVGLIIRTVAEGKLVADLDADLNDIYGKWLAVTAKLDNLKGTHKIHSELDRTSAILRDILTESFNTITVNDQAIYDDSRNYLRQIAPDKVDIVKLYKGRQPIFEHFGIDKQIKNSFGKIVTIKSGVYLIIEHTEAMHVIDINSGNRVASNQNQESNAVEVNLEAAEELARQLRLRDMGGIIVVDFIDMHEPGNRKKLYQRLREVMARDNAKHTILPPSKFGLVQITRQRVRPEMNVAILEKCPSCGGTGEVKPSIILVDEIENNLRYLIQEQNERYLKVDVHPYIYAFITKGIFSTRFKWSMHYRAAIKVVANASYHVMEYHFFNKEGDEIKI